MKPRSQPTNRCITTMSSVRLAAIYQRMSGAMAGAAIGTATTAISSVILLLAPPFARRHRILPMSCLGRPIEANPLVAEKSSPTKGHGSCCLQTPTLAEAYGREDRFLARPRLLSIPQTPTPQSGLWARESYAPARPHMTQRFPLHLLPA